MAEEENKWLKWAQEIQALGQTGLTFSENHFQAGRYKRLLEIAAEIVEAHSGLPWEEVAANFAVQPGYATPKIDVRGAVVDHGKILLVQELADGNWSMPGGWADVGETPTEMVVREVWEESGLHVQPTKVVGIYDANRGGTPIEFYHAYKIVFLCKTVGGTLSTSEETLAVDYFDFEGLPPLSTNRTNIRHLRDVRAHLLDPARSTDFD